MGLCRACGGRVSSSLWPRRRGASRTASRRRGLALWAQAPVLFTGDAGILATPTSANWMAILVVMSGCTRVVVIAAVRGLRTVRETESF